MIPVPGGGYFCPGLAFPAVREDRRGTNREQVVSDCWTLTAPGHWCTDGPVDYQSEGNYPVVGWGWGWGGVGVGWGMGDHPGAGGMRPDSPASHLPGFSQWVWGVDDCY